MNPDQFRPNILHARIAMQAERSGQVLHETGDAYPRVSGIAQEREPDADAADRAACRDH
jgi:hypothetical protein